MENERRFGTQPSISSVCPKRITRTLAALFPPQETTFMFETETCQGDGRPACLLFSF